MKQFAVIEGGIVVNTFVWDEVSAYPLPEVYAEIPEGVLVNIGFLYQDGQFVEPVEPVEEI